MNTPSECRELMASPRACWQRARLRVVRGDHTLVEIEPSLSGHSALGSTDITQLIISARHGGETLYPISEWPCCVYVARITDNAVVPTGVFNREQIQPIAWGTLFRTFQEASELVRKFQG